jgi:O-antigen ligase
MGILIIAIDLLWRLLVLKQRRNESIGLITSSIHWLMLFFLAHLTGMTYSENSGFGWMDIGTKLSFFIFPVLAFFYPIKTNLDRFAWFFIRGALVAIVVSLIFAAYNYYNRGFIAYFFDSRLSFMMHRSYWATYLVIATSFIWYFFLTGKISFGKGVILYTVFSALTFMTGSKMGILLLIITTFIWLALLLKQKKAYLLGLFTLLFMLGIGLGVDYFAPQLSTRLKSGMAVFSGKDIDPTTTESNAARILVWRSSMKVIQENFVFGVGTGDIKDKLKAQYLKDGYTGVAELNMNAHNQFLNTHVAIGIVGSLTLLLSFIFAYLRSLKQEKTLSIIVLILFLSLLTESFFETQAGIIPGAFFLAFIGFGCFSRNEEIQPSSEIVE